MNHYGERITQPDKFCHRCGLPVTPSNPLVSDICQTCEIEHRLGRTLNINDLVTE